MIAHILIEWCYTPTPTLPSVGVFGEGDLLPECLVSAL